MKVYVLTKDFDAEGRWGIIESSPIGVVLDPAGVAAPYHAHPFIVAKSEYQLPAMEAFNQASALSDAAREKLGLTPKRIARLEKAANGRLRLAPGDVVYLKIAPGYDQAPRAMAACAYDPGEGTYGWKTKAFTVAQDLADFLNPVTQEVTEKMSLGALGFLHRMLPWKSHGPKFT